MITVARPRQRGALRVVSVERGVDPRGLTLVAFGGAGRAPRLPPGGGARDRSYPRAASGGRLERPRPRGVRPSPRLRPALLRRGGRPHLSRAEPCSPDLEQRRHADLDARVLRRFADVRYKGQSFELTVEVGHADAIASAFLLSTSSVTATSSPTRRSSSMVPPGSSPRPRGPPLGSPSSSLTRTRCRGSRTASFERQWVEMLMFAVDALSRGAGCPGSGDRRPRRDDVPLVRPGWAAATGTITAAPHDGTMLTSAALDPIALFRNRSTG